MLGVEIKVVTGDSELVTRHICAQLQVPVAGVLTAQAANLFCRIDPAAKNRIILALRARGNVVGYLGDGIDDAPALQSADVGLSVDLAVDVAKEAADMILLKHDLQILHAMLGGLVLVYLLIVELVKQCFYRWSTFDARASVAPTDGGRRTITGTGE